MVGTISPTVGRGARWKWVVGATLHVIGAAAGGASSGLALGWCGEQLISSETMQSWGLVGLGVALVFLGMRHYKWISCDIPELLWQVPRTWKETLHPFLAWTIYGVILGSGLPIRSGGGITYLLLLGAMVVGEPWRGGVLLGLFGLVRGVFVVAVSASLPEQERTTARSLQAARRALRWGEVGHGMVTLCAGAAILFVLIAGLASS